MAFEISTTPSSGRPVRSGSGGSAPSRRKRGVAKFGYLMASGGRNTGAIARQGIEDPRRPKGGSLESSNKPSDDSSRAYPGDLDTSPGPSYPLRPVSQILGETGTGEDSWASYGTVPSILGALLRKRKKVLGGSNLQDTGTLGGTTMRNTGDV